MGNARSRATAKEQVVETSTGTHLLEVHMPSMGSGTIVVALVFVLGLLYILAKYCRSQRPHASMHAHRMDDHPPAWSRAPVYRYDHAHMGLADSPRAFMLEHQRQRLFSPFVDDLVPTAPPISAEAQRRAPIP